MKRTLWLAALAAALTVAPLAAQEPADYVNPFIGTTNFGTTNPGAVCPNGMMSVVPFNVMGSELNRYDKDARWWSTPYEYYNKFFTGFSHVNLSGVGCPEMGSLLLMATTGPLEVDYHRYGSEYSRETATPGYYSNFLDKYGILAEVSATLRSGVTRFTFPAGESHILLNLGEGLTNESGAFVRRVSDTEIEGAKLLGTFCYNPQAVFPIYFVMRVNKRPEAVGYWKMQPPKQGVEAEWDKDNGRYKLYTRYGKEIAGDDIGVWFTYRTTEGEQIEVQMGVSFVSMENARMNLDAEQQGKDFDAVRAEARARWNDDLGRIRVEGGSREQREVFYTGLYHALIHPNLLQDVNGEYPAMESSEIRTTKGDRYTVFSLWDTYRNVHQLMTLVYPERQLEMVRSMVDIYKEWGWMPKWELFGRETFTMEGDPAIPVIVDTWMKGLRDFDVETAYEAFLKSATTPGAQNKLRPDIDPYIERGYVPLGFYAKDLAGDASVSHALEYYIADHALSRLADSLGREEDARLFRQRSLGYRHYYDKEYGTLRPITQDGSFLTPFDPKAGENFTAAPGFHEGSAWNYTFYVPHDVEGLVRLMGGKRKFVDKLQMVFDTGLYDPANEPDIAYAYLFSYFKGEEWRTQREVRRLTEKYFTTQPDGIPGNDDTGTMSTWAVFSMMGLYPDCPGEPFYTLTSPVFDKVTIRLDPRFYGRDELVIETRDNAPGNIYIGSMTLGGKPLRKYRISHDELLRGGTLTFDLRKEHR
ncbi:GH92 family glycosyl hydrolase [uncultured Alistipes sp.]|uniref:GH92 family glycosyl hydrolase n=1 Tax=uncultured Alistipes sp. TaxID=538949 RepID=UPI002804F62D|nr:GH92 family glycosyl hydrolase [uncultured Alistipes sp.]